MPAKQRLATAELWFFVYVQSLFPRKPQGAVMRTKIVLLLLLSLAVANSWASPLVTYSNLGPGGAIQCCIGLAEGVAQNNYVQGFQFQAGTSGSLASILLGYGTGPGTGSATFSLYSDSGNAPGSLLESMTG